MFLSTLAVADDIIAILVIAIFYGHAPAFGWLLAAAGSCSRCSSRSTARTSTRSSVPGAWRRRPLVVRVPVWRPFDHRRRAARVYHPVRLARQPPELRRLVREEDSPGKGRASTPKTPLVGQKEYIRNVRNLSAVSRQVIHRRRALENALYPWVYFLILPLFALANADVSHLGDIASVFWQPCVSGRVLRPARGQAHRHPAGKRHRREDGALPSCPEHVNWRHMVGAAVLGGVGFTMAIFVANLAYDSEAALTSAKLAILLASAVAGVAGFAILSIEARAAAARGVEYVEVAAGEDNMQHADREETRQAERMLDRMSERDCRAYREACVDDEPHELEVTLSDGAERTKGTARTGRALKLQNRGQSQFAACVPILQPALDLEVLERLGDLVAVRLDGAHDRPMTSQLTPTM